MGTSASLEALHRSPAEAVDEGGRPVEEVGVLVDDTPKVVDGQDFPEIVGDSLLRTPPRTA
jgi:hypothetical protein